MSSAPPVDDPASLSVHAAYELFLDARRMEYTDETLRDYETRLRQFVEWTDDREDIATIADVTAWHLEQFRLWRQGQGLAPSTMKGQMQTLKVWLEYCGAIGAVDEMLPYKVQVPTPDKDELTSDTILEGDAAQALIEQFRAARVEYACEEHVALELAWFTGARLGGMHALDLGDYHSDEEYVHFRHRPPTVLKKKNGGERAVELPAETCDVLDVYVDEVRTGVRDNEGRDPLLCSTQGRPTTGTIRNWIYNATIPCRYGPCPHDKHPRRCEWTERNEAHHCPSSRAPHHVRSGSITWQLNRGLTYEEVGERVNSDPETLRRYYDKADDVDKMRRRDGLVDRLNFDESSESHQDSNQCDSDPNSNDEPEPQ